jgi:hypothetical protein
LASGLLCLREYFPEEGSKQYEKLKLEEEEQDVGVGEHSVLK